jgi:hypothetical protein
MNGANFGDIDGDGMLEIVTLTYVQNFSPDDPVYVTAYALNQPVENLVFGTYKGCNDRMGWIREEEVVVSCNPVRDLEAETGGDVSQVYLHWSEPESGSTGNLLGYLIQKNGELLEELLEMPEYVDNEVEFFQTYEYVVIAVFDDNCESACAPLAIELIPDAVPEYSKEAKVYPNPAQNMLHIEGTGLTEVEVFNIMGQSILNINDNIETVDISHLKNGIYFIRIKTTEGEKTVKIVIKK